MLILTWRCDVVSDVINIENTFSGIISDDLSISIAKLNFSKNISKFLKWPPFWCPASFVIGSPTGSWMQRLETSPIPYILKFWSMF